MEARNAFQVVLLLIIYIKQILMIKFVIEKKIALIILMTQTIYVFLHVKVLTNTMITIPENVQLHVGLMMQIKNILLIMVIFVILLVRKFLENIFTKKRIIPIILKHAIKKMKYLLAKRLIKRLMGLWNVLLYIIVLILYIKFIY